MNIYIYILRDPRDGAVKYVGQSNNPQKRLYQHVNDDLTNRTKVEWMQGLIANGLLPIMEIACEVCQEDATAVEVALIRAYASQGCDLLNKSLNPKERRVIELRKREKKELLSKIDQLNRMAEEQHSEKITLKNAIDLACEMFPDVYSDKRKVHNLLRIKSYQGRIPGAYRLSDGHHSWGMWLFDKTKLIRWLSDPEMHRPGNRKTIEE